MMNYAHQAPATGLRAAFAQPVGWAPTNPDNPVLPSEVAPISGPAPAKRRADILACADVLQQGVGRRKRRAEDGHELPLRALILYRTLNGRHGAMWPVPELIAERLSRVIVAVRTRPGFSPSPAAHREAVLWFSRHLGHPSALNGFGLPAGVSHPRTSGFWQQDAA